MFSFHKPKIYRSIQGCCICRAKSSSSRFTDSKRYENDFTKCFEIDERRSGEICNACVLLVKRWKKLPVGSTRTWHHVVDARAGPGTKSMNKIKNKAKLEEKLLKKKHRHKHKKPQSSKSNGSNSNLRSTPGGLSDDVADDFSDHSSQSGDYLSASECSEDERGSHSSKRRKQTNPLQYSSFLDLNYWKKTETCCGVIFKGPRGDVVIDLSLMHPCRTCKPTAESSEDGQSPAAATNEESIPSSPAQKDSAAKLPLKDDCDFDEDDDLEDADEEDEDEEDIVDELELDEELIGNDMDVEEDENEEEATDSGLGSQEVNMINPPLQTAEAMLHAMSTGADLLLSPPPSQVIAATSSSSISSPACSSVEVSTSASLHSTATAQSSSPTAAVSPLCSRAACIVSAL